MINFKMRKMVDGDVNFILSSWAKSYRTTKNNRRMVNGVYYPNTTKVITEIMTRAEKIVIYNPEPGKKDHIFGYAIFEYIGDLLVIHFIYIKHMYRRLGIVSEIIKRLKKNDVLPIICTFATDIFDIKKDDYNLMYNPFMR